MSESEIELIEGSGNVFRDLDDPDADVKHAKAVLAARIIATLDDRRRSVRKAAASTPFAAADFSPIRNADLGRFALDRLMKMLAALDRELQITVHVDSRHRDESATVATVHTPRQRGGRLARKAVTPSRKSALP